MEAAMIRINARSLIGWTCVAIIATFGVVLGVTADAAASDNARGVTWESRPVTGGAR